MGTADLSPLPDDVRARLERTSTATLATVLFAHGFRSRVLRSTRRLRPGPIMVGVARTLRYIAEREDLDTLERWKRDDNPQRRIVDEIEPGQILMIDARESKASGTMGGMLVARMMARGAAGIVSDGPFRDGPFIADLEFPSYANGFDANTNLIAHHPEDLDLAITCGGVHVRPGDAVVGDDESVIVVPRHLVADVAKEAFEKEREEVFIERRILAGSPLRGTYPMDEATRAAYEEDRRGDG